MYERREGRSDDDGFDSNGSIWGLLRVRRVISIMSICN